MRVLNAMLIFIFGIIFISALQKCCAEICRIDGFYNYPIETQISLKSFGCMK